MKKCNLLKFALVFWVVVLALQLLGVNVEEATLRKIQTIAILPVVVLGLMLLNIYWGLLTSSPRTK